MGKGDAEPKSSDFMDTLERGVRAVLRSKDAKPSEKVAAIAAGTKLLAIKHKIDESEGTGFFNS